MSCQGTKLLISTSWNSILNRVCKLKLKCFTQWQEFCFCLLALCLSYMTYPNFQAGAIGWYQEYTGGQMRCCIWRGWKLICLHLLRKKMVRLSSYRPRGKRIWTRMTIFSLVGGQRIRGEANKAPEFEFLLSESPKTFRKLGQASWKDK